MSERKAETMAISYLIPEDKSLVDELDEQRQMYSELKTLMDSWVDKGYVKRFLMIPQIDIEERVELIPGKKSDGVHDVFKWLERKCKEQRLIVDAAQRDCENNKYWSQFADTECIATDSKIRLREEKSKLDILVNLKVSVEKYWKKLKHEER